MSKKNTSYLKPAPQPLAPAPAAPAPAPTYAQSSMDRAAEIIAQAIAQAVLKARAAAPAKRDQTIVETTK